VIFQYSIPKIGEKSTKRRKENDWTDQYIDDDDENEEEENIDRSELKKWFEEFEERIRRCESIGFVVNAFELCQYAIQNEDFLELIPMKKILHFEYLFNSFSGEIFIEKMQNDVDICPLLRLIKSKHLFDKIRFDHFLRSIIFNLNSIEQIHLVEFSKETEESLSNSISHLIQSAIKQKFDGEKKIFVNWKKISFCFLDEFIKWIYHSERNFIKI